MSVLGQVDHAALAPAYSAAGAAVLVFLADLIVSPTWRRRAGLLLSLAGFGVATVGVVALVVTGTAGRASFCIPAGRLPADAGKTLTVGPSCSYVTNDTVIKWIVALVLFTLVTLIFSWRARVEPVGEYCFLLLCSLTGAVVLVGARDLITLVIALATLTLPLYVLVALGMRRQSAIQGATTFFFTSVMATSVVLLGVGLLYALTGAVHFDRVALVLARRDELADVPLTAVACVLIVLGLVFKLAAVPFHAWAPTSYDAAPLPIALFLATVSVFGGLVAVSTVVGGPLASQWNIVGPVLAVVAVATMTVGNLMALRQQRLIRLLGWSSVAQIGYVLAPLGVLGSAETTREAENLIAASWSYFSLYLVITIATLTIVIAVRGAADGGFISDYRGLARQYRWAAVGLVIGLAGLAGLPPGFAGLFAKVAVVWALVQAHAVWLALIVILNAVIGVVYYLRVGQILFASRADAAVALPISRPSSLAYWLAVMLTVVSFGIGLIPQPLLHMAEQWSSSLLKLWIS